MFTAALLKFKRFTVYPIPVQLCGQRQINLLTKSGVLKKVTRIRDRKKTCFRICSFKSYHTKKGSEDQTCPKSVGESNHKSTLLQNKTEEFMNMITNPEVQKKVADLITILKKQLVIPSVPKSDKVIQRKGVTRQSRKTSSNKTAYQKNQEIQNSQLLTKKKSEVVTATSDKETENNTTTLSDYAALTSASFASGSTNDDSGHKRTDLTGEAHWRLLAEQNVAADSVPKPTQKESTDQYAKPDPRVQYPHKPLLTRRSVSASDIRARIKQEQIKLCSEQDKTEINKSYNLNSMSHDTDQSKNEIVENKDTTRENIQVSHRILKQHDTIHGIKPDSTLMDTKQNEEDIIKEPTVLTKMSSTAPSIGRKIEEQSKEINNTSCKLDSTSTERTREDNPKLEKQTTKDYHVPFLNKSVLYTDGSNKQEGEKQISTEKTSGKLDSTSTNIKKEHKEELTEELKEISNKHKKDFNLQSYAKAMLNSAHVNTKMKVRMPEEETKNARDMLDASAAIGDSKKITDSNNISTVTNVLFAREPPDYNSSTPKVAHLSSVSKSNRFDKRSVVKRMPLYNQPTSVKHEIDQEPTDRSVLLTSNDQEKQMHPDQHEIEQKQTDELESTSPEYKTFINDMKRLLTASRDATYTEQKGAHPRLLAARHSEESDLYSGTSGGSGMPDGKPIYGAYYYGKSYYPDELSYYPSSYYPMGQDYWSYRNTSQHKVPRSVESRAKDRRRKNTLQKEMDSPNPLDQLWSQGFLIGKKLTPMSSRQEFNYNYSPLFNVQSNTLVPEQKRENAMIYKNVSDSQLNQRDNNSFNFNTSHMQSYYPPESFNAPRKCLTSAEMLEYAKVNQTPQTFSSYPNLPTSPFSLPSQPMQSVTGPLGSSVISGFPAQGMFGLTGHEILSSPGHFMPGFPGQRTAGAQGLVIPSFPGSVTPGLPTQEMYGSPGYALGYFPGTIMPGYSTQEMIGSPGYAFTGFPGQVTPGLPGQVLPGLPGQVMPGLPGQIIPGLSGHAMPGLPGQVMPGLPGEAMPGLPGYLTPGLPGEVTPGVEGQVIPGLAIRGTADLQRNIMSGLPAQEVLILPEQPSYLMQGQTSPSPSVQIISSLPDVAVPTVPACADQSVLLCPGQIMYSVPNSFRCP